MGYGCVRLMAVAEYALEALFNLFKARPHMLLVEKLAHLRDFAFDTSQT
jgi:hypothetical protein